MNARDRKQIDKLFNKIEILNNSIEQKDKLSINMHYKIDKILSVLEDDPNSNNIGLISKVNKLEKSIHRLNNANLIIKRASVFLLTIAAGLITFIIKNIISKEL